MLQKLVIDLYSVLGKKVMHGLAVYVEKGLPFTQGLSLENSVDSYLCF